MLSAMETKRSKPVERALFVLSAILAPAGLLAAIAGVYWDDAWHTDRGRDSFFSPPHAVLYTGVGIVVAVLAIELSGAARIGGRRTLGAIGVAGVIASAPVDEWWHRAFGRDAVLWSPPHLLAVAGTIAVASALWLRPTRSPAGPASIAIRGAGLLAAWLVLVLEYDTDVPQYSTVWYLPIVAGATWAAVLTIEAVTTTRWAATLAGVGYTAVMALIKVGLGVAGFSTPIIPVVLPLLLGADISRQRGRGPIQRGALHTTLAVTTVPILLVLVPGSVVPTVAQVAIGAPGAFGLVQAITYAFTPPELRTPNRYRRMGRRQRPGATSAFVALLAIVMSLVSNPTPADAHDPGQGNSLGPVTLEITTIDRTIRLELQPPNRVELAEARIIARRAGRVFEAHLIAEGDRWFGEVEVDEFGRWFVYLAAADVDGRVEAWAPVVVEDDRRTSASRQSIMYRPTDSVTTRTQVAAGLVLTIATTTILAAIAAATRRASRRLAHAG
jgi:hypothetical protein